ncbi:hypothetical protein [Nevskia soli]|uniref:hypothetical protein n=1 Tax=Nevskia soli TaxID=418856 RepID=UPI0012F81D32|nr:hypothetical protein [Nevskia soli]
MPSLTNTLIAGLLTLGSACARADIYVIVNKSSPVHSLKQQEVQDLYMGHTHSFSNGDYALCFDLPRDGVAYAAFYRTLTGMSAAQLGSYWARLMFTGQTLPPQHLPSEDEMLAVVGRNPSAIGYLSRQPTDQNVRVVLVLKTPD